MQRDFMLRTSTVDVKSICTKLLQQYKGLPCLWDPTHELYSQKSVRQKGYEQLLKTYRRMNPTATMTDLKKKLENMRACYKRERSKVYKAQLNGDEHVPVLWYYNLYRFLDDGIDNDHTASSSPLKMSVFQNEKGDEETFEEERLDEVEMLEEYEIDYLKSEESNPLSNNKKQNIIYVTDGGHDTCDTYEIGNGSFQSIETSTDAFGKTVGLQLKELQTVQRFIAEKLISDVIFHGRLGELSCETRLNLKNNYENDSE